MVTQFGNGRASNYIRHFTSELRNLILEAGRANNLLRLSYDGYDRDIEPYSLAFKRRRDGEAKEYFYAWDLTGGQRGTTGIKCFTPDKVRSLKILTQTFEPRFSN